MKPTLQIYFDLLNQGTLQKIAVVLAAMVSLTKAARTLLSLHVMKQMLAFLLAMRQ